MDDAQKRLFLSADAVCFDVDSTVITGEGIDDLAHYCGVGKQVSQLTNKAMSEGLSFREALKERLQLMKLTKSINDRFVGSNPYTLTPGVKLLIKLLHSAGKDVYLVSGGFRSIILPIADELNIPTHRVYANQFIFHINGDLIGFDESEPTSSSGGKKLVVSNLINKHNYKSVVTIGDGVTDYETYPPASLFIGFGGNKIRPKVRDSAPCFIYSFDELTNLIKEQTP